MLDSRNKILLEARRRKRHENRPYTARETVGVAGGGGGGGAGYGAVGGAALLNIEPHSFEDTGLGFFDGIPKPVYSWKILAIGVVLPVFTFDRDGVGVHLHNRILSRDAPGQKSVDQELIPWAE